MDFEKIISELKGKYFNKSFISKNKSKLIKYGVLCCILIAGALYLVYDFSSNEKITVDQGDASQNKDSIDSEIEISDKIIVDVGGEVESPQVVELDYDARVEDAIIKAGGLTKNADTSSLNRAAILTDGEKVYVPSIISEENTGDTIVAGTPPPNGGVEAKVNINTSDATMLQEIPGVGPATAIKIVDYRTSNGSFKKIEDIKNVNGIGDKTYEEMKDHITC